MHLQHYDQKAMIQLGVAHHSRSAPAVVGEVFCQPWLVMSLWPECRHSVELDMARALVGYQCYVEGELRCVPGSKFAVMIWPGNSGPADQWWKACCSRRSMVEVGSSAQFFPRTAVMSINSLKARALLPTLRGRTRTQDFLGFCCLRLWDGQVVIGAMRHHVATIRPITSSRSSRLLF